MQALLFPELSSRAVVVDFEAGHVSRDGGSVLLARLDRSHGYTQRFAQCFQDYRDQDLIEHELLELLRQRVYGLALGYEDLNDHDRLCTDPLLASLCGKTDPLGRDRLRRKDRGKALSGKSTLNRLELTPADADGGARYKKIVPREEAIEDYFIQEYVRHLSKDTERVTLNLDAALQGGGFGAGERASALGEFEQCLSPPGPLCPGGAPSESRPVKPSPPTPGEGALGSSGGGVVKRGRKTRVLKGKNGLRADPLPHFSENALSTHLCERSPGPLASGAAVLAAPCRGKDRTAGQVRADAIRAGSDRTRADVGGGGNVQGNGD